MGKITIDMGRAILVLAVVLAGCAPEPTSRELLLDGVQEVRTEQRQQRVQIKQMQDELRQIDSLINLYEQLP